MIKCLKYRHFLLNFRGCVFGCLGLNGAMFPNAPILLTPDEMAAVDTAAAASGLSSFSLMERAGQAVAAAALKFYPGTQRFLVLAGPGNNGGDAYVAARALCGAGAKVEIHALADPACLAGDARQAFDLYAGEASAVFPQPLHLYRPAEGDLVIDGIFGAGLSRDVSDEVAEIIARVEKAGIPVLSIDLPSGVCGARGLVLGAAFKADRTVTFMTRKPGHLLMPGRALCGAVAVFDIGIPQRILAQNSGQLAVNGPAAWRASAPTLGSETHKYRRGHLVVFSGGRSHSGAARLSAAAALHMGAGLVTIASPGEALSEQAPALTAVMLRQIDTSGDLQDWLAAGKLAAFVIGPGFGIGEKARDFVRAIAEKPLVVDADAITSFAAGTGGSAPEDLFLLFEQGETRLVLTPHEGEFGRLFPDLAGDARLGKVEKARAAALRAHAVIVYKGADTVVAHPDGRALINENAQPWLATAGSGDVLAGLIGALLAQGMPAFEAAAAGVFLHGEAGMRAGLGMTAETLVQHLRPIEALRKASC